jgi:hypothetical protein
VNLGFSQIALIVALPAVAGDADACVKGPPSSANADVGNGAQEQTTAGKKFRWLELHDLLLLIGQSNA